MSAMKRLTLPDGAPPRPRLWVLLCIFGLLLVLAVLIELHIRGLEHPPWPPHMQGALHHLPSCSAVGRIYRPEAIAKTSWC